MELQELQYALAKIKKGQYFAITYRTTKLHKKQGVTLEKETQTIARLVEYSHINGVEVKGKPNPNEQYVDSHIIYNSNTDKYYLLMATTQNPNYKAKVVYKVNGKIVNKETYQQYDQPNPNQQPLIVFKKCIDDIISIG